MMSWSVCSVQGKGCDMREKNNLSDFLKSLKANKGNLTRQQFRTIKGQALAGDIEGAKKGMYKLLERRCG